MDSHEQDVLRKELTATQLVVETLRHTLRGRTHANAILRDELTAEQVRRREMHLRRMNDAAETTAVAAALTAKLDCAHARIAERTAERDAAYARIAKLEGALRHAHADHATDACAYADAHAHALARAHATAQFEKDRLIAFKLADVEKKEQSLARAMSGGGAAAADIRCSVCTFDNTLGASTCKMCDSKLH